METVDLRKLFLDLQMELAASLQTDRNAISHAPTMGAASERGWRAMLETYLPKRYCVSEAFVIDSNERRSEQIDLVIYDRQYSPFLFHHHGALFIPAESVYAVFEVKQTLDAETLAYAVAKAASVRSLERTSVAITHLQGNSPGREPFPILSGLLCLDSSWKPTFGKSLRKALTVSPPEGRLDLLCALKHGALEVHYPEGGEIELDRSAPDTALIFFFLRLLERLQGLGTVPAMDLRKYGKVLEG